MANPVLNPTLYARVTGIALAAVALLGIVVSIANPTTGELIAGFLAFDWTHNILHVVLAGVALFVGFSNGGAYARNYARIFGIVYTGLGIAGFFWGGITPATTTAAGVLALELGENLVHVLIGAWGLACGWIPAGTTAGTTRTTRGA